MSWKNEAGFTLIEIVVAMILVMLVGASVLMAFVNASRWTDPSALAAVYDVRGRLDQLYESVRQDRWNNSDQTVNPLYATGNTGTTYNNFAPVTLNGRSYTQSYVVSSVSLDGGVTEAYRKVEATESWIT